MNKVARAKQFLPFDALKGLQEALREREKEIEKFALNNKINLEKLNEIINEYEYSSIFPDKEINEAIEIDDYWERRTVKNSIKEFIKNIFKKFL